MGRSAAILLAMAQVLAACSASGSAAPTPEPQRSPERSPMPSLNAPTPTDTPSETTAEPTASPSAAGPLDPDVLEVEGFAEVVADRLQVRAAPGLGSDLVQTDCYGYPAGADGCPPLILGRDDSPWLLTSVYLLDGPVTADGYDWYLVATESQGTLYWNRIGWVAAGDGEDAWLIRREVTCPAEPIELADVTFAAISPLTLLYCLGGREITVRGYYTDPPPGEPLEGDCTSEPAWLVCTWGGHILRVEPGTWAGDANHLELHLHPDIGAMPPRPGWIEVTGQFDHPAAHECGDGSPASDLFCRVAFVVTGARSAE